MAIKHTCCESEMGQFHFRNRNWNRNRTLFKLDGIRIESTTDFSVGIGIGIDLAQNLNQNRSIPALIFNWNLDSRIGIEPAWNRNRNQ